VGLRPAAALGAVAVLVLAGCGSDDAAAPPDIQVRAGTQQVDLAPTQYCLDGAGQRYSTTPPIIQVGPDTPITFTVPSAVADRGWAVQVFDDTLEQKIGVVDVDEGKAVFDGINSSDVVPAAFYLVVVEDEGGACSKLSGAWPVGFIRAGATTAPSSGAG